MAAQLVIVQPKKEPISPEWRENHAKLNDKLYLPDRGTYNEALYEQGQWYSVGTKVSKNYYAPLTSSFDVDFSKPEVQTRIKKFQIRVDKEFRKTLEYAFHVCRHIYNLCIDLSCGPEPKCPATLKALRALLTTNSTSILPEEYKQVPQNIRDDAVRDFIKALNTQKMLVATGKKKIFQMHHRKRKIDVDQTLALQKKDHRRVLHKNKLPENQVAWFIDKWGKPFKSNEVIPEIKHDCRLQWTRDGKFYLHVPMDVMPKKKLGSATAALDPGVRIFQTTYDTNHNMVHWGDKREDLLLDKSARIAQRMRNGIKRVWRNAEQKYLERKQRREAADYERPKIKSRKECFEAVGRDHRKTKNRRERLGLRKAAIKIEIKINNKIDALHRNLCKFLCTNYNTVLIPKFGVVQMAQRRNPNGTWKRKIDKVTTRRMIRWGHYKFRQLLIAKGAVTGTKIIECSEAYSSKTCSNCLNIKWDLKGQEVYDCASCGKVMHRDGNAARNILIMNWHLTGNK